MTETEGELLLQLRTFRRMISASASKRIGVPRDRAATTQPHESVRDVMTHAQYNAFEVQDHQCHLTTEALPQLSPPEELVYIIILPVS